MVWRPRAAASERLGRRFQERRCESSKSRQSEYGTIHRPADASMLPTPRPTRPAATTTSAPQPEERSLPPAQTCASRATPSHLARRVATDRNPLLAQPAPRTHVPALEMERALRRSEP